jgi:hypothetical protein
LQCNRCELCEYTTKSFGGRTTEGCFDRTNAKPSGSEGSDGRPYLDGDKPTENDLIVIPHYKIWDPGAIRSEDEPGFDPSHPSRILRYPYQSRAEPLSKKAWIQKFKEAAPRVQRLLDAGRQNLIWAGNNANGIECDQDIVGRMQKFKSLRRECKEMQATVDMLQRGTQFEETTQDAAGATQKVQCVEAENHKCDALNCYSSDKQVQNALLSLSQRNQMCKVERDQARRASEMAALAEKRKERTHPPPPKKKAGAKPNPCRCKPLWSEPGDSAKCVNIVGCPAESCDGGAKPWCAIENPGCDEEETTDGGGWAFCVPPQAAPPGVKPNEGAAQNPVSKSTMPLAAVFLTLLPYAQAKTFESHHNAMRAFL